MDQPIERHSQAMGLAALQMFSLSCNIQAEMSPEKCKVVAWSMRIAQNGGSGGRSASTHPSVDLLLLRGVTITDLSTSQSFAIQTPVNFLLLFMWQWRKFFMKVSVFLMSSPFDNSLSLELVAEWLLSTVLYRNNIGGYNFFFCLAFPLPHLYSLVIYLYAIMENNMLHKYLRVTEVMHIFGVPAYLKFKYRSKMQMGINKSYYCRHDWKTSYGSLQAANQTHTHAHTNLSN